MPDSIYLIDTNILIQWLAAYLPNVQSSNPHFQNETAIHIRWFMEKSNRTIYVPDLVWVEFLGVILHKDMDVSADLDQLRYWFRQREIYIQQMERLIRLKHRFFSCPREESPFLHATLLVGDLNLIDDSTFGWLSKIRKVQNKGKEKLLDGMDSVILIYLNALAKLNRDKRTVLYTADYRLCRILPRVRKYHQAWFAQNTDTKFAFQKARKTYRMPTPIS